MKAKVVLWRLSPTNKPSSFVFGETIWCPGWAGQSKHHRSGSIESGASGALTRGGLFSGTRVARCGNAARLRQKVADRMASSARGAGDDLAFEVQCLENRQRVFKTLHYHAGLPPASHPVKRPAVPSKSIRLHAQSLEHRDKQVRKRQLLRLDVTVPTRIRIDSRSRLIVFVASSKLQIAAVPEPQVLSASGNNRIVAR